MPSLTPVILTREEAELRSDLRGLIAKVATQFNLGETQVDLIFPGVTPEEKEAYVGSWLRSQDFRHGQRSIRIAPIEMLKQLFNHMHPYRITWLYGSGVSSDAIRLSRVQSQPAEPTCNRIRFCLSLFYIILEYRHKGLVLI